jgi:hypothetical protein
LDGTTWKTTNTFAVHPNATQTYTLYIQSAAGCTASLENAATVTVNDLPAMPTGASSNTRCDAGTVTFSASVPSGVTIDWYDDVTGGAIVPGGQGVTAFSPSLNTTATYHAQARDHTTGCVSATRLPVTATVTPTPEITNQPAGTAICSGGTVKLTVAATNATAYQWRKNGSDVSEGSNYTTAAYTTVALAANATYSVVVYNNACSTVSNNAVVTVHTASTASTTLTASTTTVCSGSPVTLTAAGGTLGTAASYQFGTGATTLTSTTATTYTLSSVTATATYWVKVITTSACAAPSGSATRNITVHTASIAPTTLTASTTTVCSGSPVTLTATGGTLGTAASYQFGTGNTTLTSTTATSYTLSSVTATATYWVKIVTTSACAAPSGSATRAITVTTAITEASISGDSSNACPNASVSLTASASGATSFTWYKNSSQVQTGASSAYAVTSTGSYTVQGKNANCTGKTSPSKVVTISTVDFQTCCPGVKLYQTTASRDGILTWSEADAYCKGKGARLPTMAELMCICEYQATVPGGFDSQAEYWSSETGSDGSWIAHSIWYWNMCRVSAGYSNETLRVRCVL